MTLLIKKLNMRRKLVANIVVAVTLLCFSFGLPKVVESSSSDSRSRGRGDAAEGHGVVNVVLIGATGDLSKKYLWQGIFNLISEEQDQVFHLYAGARSRQETGEREMKTILEQNVSCARLPATVSNQIKNCEELKAAFAESVPYYELKKADDYKRMCGDIQRKMQAVGLRERGRIVYLSVPPFAYASIAESISEECRPVGDAWLRVVVEKPFGHDSKSAKELSASLKQHLNENEIYRIDHYLGKTGVQSIVPFRAMNKETYGGLWNRGHIERVEIVMKEALDSKGRISFYDKYGVIRDVMQNHLTEIMALVAMEIPRNLSNIHDMHREKLSLLSQVDHVMPQQAVIGQYESYIDEWRVELKRETDNATNTPTYAAVMLSLSNPLWSDVPFLMVAGKKLDEKLVYLRILFKNNDFCTVTPNNEDGDHACKPKQIVFFVGSSKHPTVAVSKSLPKPEVPKLWKVPELEDDATILGSPLSDFYYFSAGAESDAYSLLIQECYHGNRDKFIGTSDLVASWDIWTPLLHELVNVQPRRYPGGRETGRWLDFRMSGRKLTFVHQVDEEWDVENSKRFGIPTMSGISRTFRSSPLFTGDTDETVAFLAKHLLMHANTAIKERGKFHVAFPGGKTPERLFVYLFLRMRHVFPWRETHIWFTDERCVPMTDADSNFKLIYSTLLQYISIPYTSVHPMPVQLANGLCDPRDNGSEIYSAEMRRSLPDSRLDYVVLGVGGDGHVASLFPYHETLADSDHLVVLSDRAQSHVRNRMSLGYEAVNSARDVAIHILGKQKHELVEILKQEHYSEANRFPVLGVEVEDGNMTWFIDHEALL